jgi:hypothetical protein
MDFGTWAVRGKFGIAVFLLRRGSGIGWVVQGGAARTEHRLRNVRPATILERRLPTYNIPPAEAAGSGLWRRCPEPKKREIAATFGRVGATNTR